MKEFLSDDCSMEIIIIIIICSVSDLTFATVRVRPKPPARMDSSRIRTSTEKKNALEVFFHSTSVRFLISYGLETKEEGKQPKFSVY